MDPLKKLEGRSWKEWRALANDIDSAQSDESFSNQDSSCVKLPRSDMHIYGLCPGKEIFELVECSLCQKKIKMPVLFNHIKTSHPSQMEIPAREKTQQVETLVIGEATPHGWRTPRQGRELKVENKTQKIKTMVIVSGRRSQSFKFLHVENDSYEKIPSLMWVRSPAEFLSKELNYDLEKSSRAELNSESWGGNSISLQNNRAHDMQPFVKLLRLPLVAMASTTDDGDKQFNDKRKEDSAQPPLTFHDSNSIFEKLLSVQLPLVEKRTKAFKRCLSFKENSLKSSVFREDKIHKMCGFGLWQPGFRRAGGLLLASPHFPSLKSTSATQLKMSTPTINSKSHTQHKNKIEIIKNIKNINNVKLEPRKTLAICNRPNRKLIRAGKLVYL